MKKETSAKARSAYVQLGLGLLLLLSLKGNIFPSQFDKSRTRGQSSPLTDAVGVSASKDADSAGERERERSGQSVRHEFSVASQIF